MMEGSDDDGARNGGQAAANCECSSSVFEES